MNRFIEPLVYVLLPPLCFSFTFWLRFDVPIWSAF